jgi:hypothetical protein
MVHRGSSLAFAALFLFAALSVPAPRATAAAGPDALHGGAWAIELDKDMGSGAFGENEISIKRMSSASTAFRLAFGISYDGGSGSGSNVSLPSGSTVPTTRSNFNRNYTIRLNWVHHFAMAQNFDAQLGVGPVVSFYSSSNGYGDSTGYSSTYWYRSTQVGGELNLGAEWFFSNRFSLGGRAGLVATTGKYKYRNHYFSGSSGNTDSYEYTESRIFTDGARIFLGAYF